MFQSRGMGSGRVSLSPVARAVTRVSVGGGGGHGTLSSSTINGSFSSRRNHVSVASLVSSVSSNNYVNKNSDISGIPIWDSGSAECEWVVVDGTEDDGDCGHGFRGHHSLWHVPSEDEVEDAVFALQSVFGPGSPIQQVRGKYNHELDNDGSELDWVEPSLSPYRSRILQTHGSGGVYYALHLLQTEPSVQKMVKSFSSDKAVWDAILKNEALQELRESLFEDEELNSKSLDGISKVESHTTTNILMQMFHTVKVKFMEVFEKISMIMNELFQPTKQKKDSEAELCDRHCINEIVRISFMLSIVVLLVVVVGRRAKSSSA